MDWGGSGHRCLVLCNLVEKGGSSNKRALKAGLCYGFILANCTGLPFVCSKINEILFFDLKRPQKLQNIEIMSSICLVEWDKLSCNLNF
jgi:hypothetical protein